MKKLLLTLAIGILGIVSLAAQNAPLSSWVNPSSWTDPNRDNAYHESTLIYANVGGDTYTPQRGDKLAAFIDNELRGVYEFTGTPDVPPTAPAIEIAKIQIFGDTEKDSGKGIVFKLAVQGAVYAVSPETAVTWSGDNTPQEPSRPLVIPFSRSQVVTEVSLKLKSNLSDPLTMTVGEAIDLSETFDIVVNPATAKLPENAHWENKSDYYSISGNRLTAEKSTGTVEAPGAMTEIRLIYAETSTASSASATYSKLRIKPAPVPVTGITIDEPAAKKVINRGESFTVKYTISPATASVQGVTITLSEAGAFTIGDIESVPSDPTGAPTEGKYQFTVTSNDEEGCYKGKQSITLTTVDNGLSAMVDVEIKVPYRSISFKNTDPEGYVVGKSYRVRDLVDIAPSDAEEDSWSDLPCVVNADNALPGNRNGWEVCGVKNGLTLGALVFTPRIIAKNVVLQISDRNSGKVISQSVDFVKEYARSGKWSWVSVPYAAAFKTAEGNAGIQEVRGAAVQTYNDPQYGWFGDDFLMEPLEGYKMNNKSRWSQTVGYRDLAALDGEIAIHPNWNWIGVPWEYDVAHASFVGLNPTAPAEGDIVLSKNDGLMAYTAGGWESSLAALPFDFHSGEGYLYFRNSDVGCSLNFGAQFDGTQPASSRQRILSADFPEQGRTWIYDGTQFESAMAIIGKFTEESMGNIKQYSIGAFVENECRGEGRILEDGTILIALSGEDDELVHFKLHDNITNETKDLRTVVHYETLAGSFDHPVLFSLGYETTGIEQIDNENFNIHFKGDKLIVDGGYDYKVYSAEGKQVEEKSLPAGIYVVVVYTPNGRICQKVIKK